MNKPFSAEDLPFQRKEYKIMNIQKEYEKCQNKKCVKCKKDITMKEIVENKIEMTITKRKTIILIHKECLKGGE